MLSPLIVAVVVPAIAILVGKAVPVRPSVKRPVWAVSGLERRLGQGCSQTTNKEGAGRKYKGTYLGLSPFHLGYFSWEYLSSSLEGIGVSV